MDGWLDGWMDERMNGRVAFEYLLLTDWRRPTWQAETGGSWGLRLAWAERGRERRVNYGWTKLGRKRGEGRRLARARAPLTGKLLVGGVT